MGHVVFALYRLRRGTKWWVSTFRGRVVRVRRARIDDDDDAYDDAYRDVRRRENDYDVAREFESRSFAAWRRRRRVGGRASGDRCRRVDIDIIVSSCRRLRGRRLDGWIVVVVHGGVARRWTIGVNRSDGGDGA